MHWGYCVRWYFNQLDMIFVSENGGNEPPGPNILSSQQWKWRLSIKFVFFSVTSVIGPSLASIIANQEETSFFGISCGDIAMAVLGFFVLENISAWLKSCDSHGSRWRCATSSSHWCLSCVTRPPKTLAAWRSHRYGEFTHYLREASNCLWSLSFLSVLRFFI